MKDTKVHLQCGDCKNIATLMVRTPSVEIWEETDDYHDETTWRILQCQECSSLNLSSTYVRVFTEQYKWEVDESAKDEELEEHIIYPVPEYNKNLDLLPIEIKEAYKSALKVKNDPNSYAVSIHRTLDKVCKREKALGKGLTKKLEYLAENGRMPLALALIASEFEALRNFGAHADRTDDDVETWRVPIIEEFADAILEYLYIAPDKFKRLQRNMVSRTNPL